MTQPKPRLLGVVLAGGKSSRMGRDKAVLVHASGGTFLDYAISRLLPITPQVAVSGRITKLSNVFSILDQTVDQGPAMAVWSAIQFAKQADFGATMVTPIDMPDLESQHLQRLIDSMSTIDPTCATFDGNTPHPLIAIYPVSLEPELAIVAQSRQRSLRAWLTDRPCTLVQLPDTAKRDCNCPGEV